MFSIRGHTNARELQRAIIQGERVERASSIVAAIEKFDFIHAGCHSDDEASGIITRYRAPVNGNFGLDHQTNIFQKLGMRYTRHEQGRCVCVCECVSV